MDRDPAIHILLSDMGIVLRKLGYKNPDGMAVQIFTEASKYKITDRFVVKGRAKAVKKAERIQKAGSVSASYFEGLLAQERLAAQHRGSKPIRQGSPEFILLKEVAQLAHDFVEYYNIQPAEAGYRYYIRTGLALMGKKYSLNRFKTYNERINAKYEAFYAIESDTDKEGTEGFHEHWKMILKKYSGLDEDLSGDPEKYVCMLYGRMEADDADAYYDDWIKAQFEGLAFLNAIPNPNQFFGENAQNRYKNYVREMSIKKKRLGGYNYRDAETKSNIDKFKANRAG